MHSRGVKVVQASRIHQRECESGKQGITRLGSLISCTRMAYRRYARWWTDNSGWSWRETNTTGGGLETGACREAGLPAVFLRWSAFSCLRGNAEQGAGASAGRAVRWAKRKAALRDQSGLISKSRVCSRGALHGQIHSRGTRARSPDREGGAPSGRLNVDC